MRKILFLIIILIIWRTTYADIEIQKTENTFDNKKCISEKNCNIIKKEIKCSLNDLNVCWIKEWKYKTYRNSCFLEKDNAKYKYPWPCWNKIKSTDSNIWSKNKKFVKEIENSKKTSPEIYLSLKLKMKVNIAIWKLEKTIDKKRLSNSQKQDLIDNLILRLNKIKNKEDKYSDLIEYIIYKLKNI